MTFTVHTSDQTGFQIGDPDLEPEDMTYSVDAGFDTRLFKKFDLGVTFYTSSFEDFIGKRILKPEEVPSYLTPGQDQYVEQKVNIGKVKIYGVEATFNYALNNQWNISINYTWNRSKIKENKLDPAMEDNYLSMVPHWMFNMGLTYDNPRLFILGIYSRSVSSIYYDDKNTKEMGGYTVVDLKISRKLPYSMEVFLNIDNLTDKRYSEWYNYYAPPRWVMCGMKYIF